MKLKLQQSQVPSLELKLGLQCPKCKKSNFVRSPDIQLTCPNCGYTPEKGLNFSLNDERNLTESTFD